MKELLECYGADVVEVGKLGGSFDPASPRDTERWWLFQWEAVARRLGWLQSLQATISAIKQSGGELGNLQSAPINTFARWVERRAAELVVDGPWKPDALARVRHETIVAFRNRANPWMGAARSIDLPYGACSEGARVFSSTARPSYFRDGEGQTLRAPGCAWDGPVRISFGTFPFVSGRLGPVPDGLLWERRGTWRPAREAMRLTSSLWELSANARQDARIVAEHYANFRRFTAPLLEGLPVKPTSAGSMYRDGLLVRVHLGSEANAVLIGPRGPLAVRSYNYVLERFAGFFACREALYRRFRALSADVQAALRANTDPCSKRFTKPPVSPKRKITMKAP